MHASIRVPDAALDPGLIREVDIREVDQNEVLASEQEIRAGMSAHISRLRRYGVYLSHRRDDADDLVQATFVRALERAAQFRAGTRLDLWLFSILRSIWLNEVRARKVRAGQGLVDADSVLVFDGYEQRKFMFSSIRCWVLRMPCPRRRELRLILPMSRACPTAR